MATALNGMPQFANMQPYMNKLTNLEDVANYIRSTLKDPVDLAMLKELRQQWSGNLIVKGVLSVEDAKLVASINADAIIVSNHGGTTAWSGLYTSWNDAGNCWFCGW